MRQPDFRSKSTVVKTSVCLQLRTILGWSCLARSQQRNNTEEAKLARHWCEKLLSSCGELLQPATGVQDS